MSIGAIIQARVSSTRLPGKVNMKLGSKTIVEHIIARLQDCQTLDKIILAVPEIEGQFFRQYLKLPQLTLYLYDGDTNDVLDRFISAARVFSLDYVVRVCADSPFILPWLIDLTVAKAKRHNLDYLLTRGALTGQNVEVVKLAALEGAYPSTTPEEREHVTLYLERHPEAFKTLEFPIPQLCVDTKEDYNRLKKIARYAYV